MKHLSEIAAVAALLLLASTGAKALPPVEAFGNLPAFDNPELSPDGKHFAVIQSFNGRPAAMIYQVNAAAGAKPVVAASSEWIVDGMRWAKNDRLIIGIKRSTPKEFTGDNLVYTWSRAVSLDLEGKDPVVLLKNNTFISNNTDATEIADLDVDDPDNIYMPLIIYSDMRSPDQQMLDAATDREDTENLRLDLYRVNVRTGTTSRAATGNYKTVHWFLDGHGKPVARIDQTLKPLRDRLFIVDKDDWREIGNYDATADRGSGIAGLLHDGTALVRSNWDDQSMGVLTRLDLATGKETPLYANPGFDAGHPLYDEWTGRIAGVTYVAERREYFYFDPKLEALQKGLEASFPNMVVHAVSWDRSMNEAIVAAESPRHPLTYYFLDRTTHQATPIGSTYPDLEETDLGEMKPWPYKARDGLDIPAYLTLPPGKEPKNLPAVVMPHGGPDSRDELGFDWWVQFLANRGYAVLQPNFRGSSGYGHKFTEAGLHQWGLKMQDDITDGVKKMIADGVADPKRICIVGASYGGYATLAGAALTPDLYACAVSFAGVSDLPKILNNDRARYGRNSHAESFWNSRIGSTYDDLDQLSATSPARQADHVKCPVLLMHGEGDDNVPIEQSELMYAALKSAGKDVQFIRFPGEDHYLNFADTRIRVLKETEAFLKKNIGN